MYGSPSTIMMIESMRTRNAYKILVENPVGRRPFEMPKRRWDGTNKMAFTENKFKYGRLD
jgi:hypothetical protein